jgi:hypothetical protein
VILALLLSLALAPQDTTPVGYGALRRDDIVMRFSTGGVEIQVLPLDEQVIRLLTPDTYRSLIQLIQSRMLDIRQVAQRGGTETPSLVMVTFLGVVSQARFNPEDLNITSRGRLFRPVGIVPLSPTWSSYQLDARQQAVGIYLFEPGISVREDMLVTYGGLASISWVRSLRLLDQERARVKARAQGEVRHDSAARDSTAPPSSPRTPR